MRVITIARKPLDGTVAENVVKHGTGALNVEGCRVGPGRWPANFVLQHSGCSTKGQKRVQPGHGSGRAGEGGHGFQTQYVGGEKKGSGFAGGFVDESGRESVEIYACLPSCPVPPLDVQFGHASGAARFFKQVGASGPVDPEIAAEIQVDPQVKGSSDL